MSHPGVYRLEDLTPSNIRNEINFLSLAISKRGLSGKKQQIRPLLFRRALLLEAYQFQISVPAQRKTFSSWTAILREISNTYLH